MIGALKNNTKEIKLKKKKRNYNKKLNGQKKTI